jgi:hypothetical protein
MSNEERLKLRKLSQKDDAKEDAVVEDSTASTISEDQNASAVSATDGVTDTRTLMTNSTVAAGTDAHEEIEGSEDAMEGIDGEGKQAEAVHNHFVPSPDLRHSPQLQTLQA